MSVLVRALVLAMLAAAAWKVHDIRKTFAAGRVGDAARAASMQTRLDQLPTALPEAGWSGTRHPFEERESAPREVDCYVRNRYEDADGGVVTLYVAGASRFTDWLHKPNECMPSHGWEIREFGEVPFFEDSGLLGSMTRALTEYGRHRMLVYYWVQTASEVTEVSWGRRFQRFLDLMAGRAPTSTYLVVLSLPVQGDVAAVERRATRFVRAMMPHLVTATGDEE